MAIKFDARGGRWSRVKHRSGTAPAPAPVEPPQTAPISQNTHRVGIDGAALVGVMDNPSFILSKDRRVTCANKPFRDALDLAPDALAGQPEFSELARNCSIKGHSELLALGAIAEPGNTAPVSEITTPGGAVIAVKTIDLSDGCKLVSLEHGAGAGSRALESDWKLAHELLQNLPGAIIRLTPDADGELRCQFANPAAHGLLCAGQMERSLYDRPFSELVWPDDLPRVVETVVTAMNSENTKIDIEFQIIGAGEKPTWLRAIGNASKTTSGEQVCDLRMIEIDKRIQVEQERDRLRRMLDMVVENIPYMVSVWDASTLECLYINKAVQEATGLAEGELVGDLDQGTIQWADCADRKRRALRMLETGQPEEYPEEVAISPTLGKRTYKTRRFPLKNSRGKIEYFLSITEDLTHQRESERVFEQTQSRFREAVENITDGVALFDADERLVQCNRRYYEIWQGLEEVAVPGAPFEEIVRTIVKAQNPKDPEKHVARRLRHFRNAPSVREVELGDKRWIHVTDTPTSDGGTVITCTDISALKEREERLRDVSNDALHAKEMAEIANRSKSDFLANMSHELRTPLNAIIGFSEIIKDSLLGDDPLEQYRTYAKDIHDSGTHLLALINDILDMSRIEAGKAEIAEDSISVIDAIETSIRLVDERALKQSISIEREFDQSLPKLRGDLRKLKQILINLLSNAVKFTEDGGRIIVSASVTASGRMLIAIRDNGIGIAEEDMARVLEPFGQADGGLDRQYEGTGLGLTLTKGLVELHGGTFTLESAIDGPEKGTTAAAIFPESRVITAD